MSPISEFPWEEEHVQVAPLGIIKYRHEVQPLCACASPSLACAAIGEISAQAELRQAISALGMTLDAPVSRSAG